MHYIDVVNGDADGICTLVQLRLAEPRPSQLVTGINRDINLLAAINAAPYTQITVLDISFEKMRAMSLGCLSKVPTSTISILLLMSVHH